MTTITQQIDPDILTRLRNGLCAIRCKVMHSSSGCDCAIAADEIERLRNGIANRAGTVPSEEVAELRKALQWIADQVDNEDADLDDIILIANRALAHPSSPVNHRALRAALQSFVDALDRGKAPPLEAYDTARKLLEGEPH